MIKTKLLKIFYALIVVLCMFCFASVVSDAEESNSRMLQNKHMPGEVIVKFSERVSEEYIYDVAGKSNISEIEDIYNSVLESNINNENVNLEHRKVLEGEIGKTYRIVLTDKTDDNLYHIIDLFKNNKKVEFAEDNLMFEAESTIPLDYYNFNLWGLDRIEAPEAWDTYIGSTSTKVGVLDTGVDSTHADLINCVDTTLGWNCSQNANIDTEDYNGHGTHVAGILGATGNNWIGVVGVNWIVKIAPIKICNSNSDPNSSATNETKGILYAYLIDLKICNMSFGIGNDQSLLNAISIYQSAGGLLVLAAGNSHANIDNNTAYATVDGYDNVMIIANSSSSSGELECLSSTSNYGDVVDIAAPGTGIYSTVPNNDYQVKSGTSMAAPFVSGAAALIKGKYPSMTSLQIKNAIIDAGDYVPQIAGEVSSGRRLNLYKAINLISDNSIRDIEPYDNETIQQAINRSLGGYDADVTVLRITGNAEMADGGGVNALLPNLSYLDLSSFNGSLGSSAFSGCLNLTTVILPNHIMYLPYGLFNNCSNLRTIYVKHHEKKYYEADLSYLDGVSGGNINDSTGSWCFGSCISLETVLLPSARKTKFGPCTFMYCSNLKTIYSQNVSKINYTANLNNLYDIRPCLFDGTGFHTVMLPKDVDVEWGAFYNCNYLSCIQLDSSQTNPMIIGSQAFYDVSSDCVAYMNSALVNNSSFQIYRGSNQIIPKISW